jgi:hypothetical protein
LSAIDQFYQQRIVALSLGTTGSLAASDSMRPLALIPLFAAAEMYFRQFIARAIDVCPVCSEQAGTQQVALGAFALLDRQERAFAIAEHQGLTSDGEIARRTVRTLDVDTNRFASLKEAIREFESLCHLRHAIVHTGGELMYLNRRQLGIKQSGRIRIGLSLPEFQSVTLKVSNVVRSYNLNVGTELALRWFRLGQVGAKWSTDRRRFQKLIDILWSNVDMGAAPDYRVLYNQAKAVA